MYSMFFPNNTESVYSACHLSLRFALIHLIFKTKALDAECKTTLHIKRMCQTIKGAHSTDHSFRTLELLMKCKRTTNVYVVEIRHSGVSHLLIKLSMIYFSISTAIIIVKSSCHFYHSRAILSLMSQAAFTTFQKSHS